MNVDGSDDPFYRYKMPTLAVHYPAGLRKGTRVTNITQVCQAIYRTPAELVSYFAKATGSNVRLVDNQLILSSRASPASLQAILANYIKTQVLCRCCNSPETQAQRCRACGAKQAKPKPSSLTVVFEEPV
jgi:translation initiation factor 2 subunit 2